MALDRDFRNRQVCADQFVWFSFGNQPQNLQFARSQFFRSQPFGKFAATAGGTNVLPA